LLISQIKSLLALDEKVLATVEALKVLNQPDNEAHFEKENFDEVTGKPSPAN
jgi:hypothetical protein